MRAASKEQRYRDGDAQLLGVNFRAVHSSEHHGVRDLAGYYMVRSASNWKHLDVPALAALGGGDKNVPVEESVARFGTVAPEMEVVTYSDGGHGITDPTTGRVQNTFLNDLLGFIRAAIDES